RFGIPTSVLSLNERKRSWSFQIAKAGSHRCFALKRGKPNIGRGLRPWRFASADSLIARSNVAPRSRIACTPAHFVTSRDQGNSVRRTSLHSALYFWELGRSARRRSGSISACHAARSHFHRSSAQFHAFLAVPAARQKYTSCLTVGSSAMR